MTGHRDRPGTTVRGGLRREGDEDHARRDHRPRHGTALRGMMVLDRTRLSDGPRGVAGDRPTGGIETDRHVYP
jgi:hypothetical protein